jgi:histidyl-tRNA synthetase
MVALGIKNFEIRVNSRLILNGLLEIYGLADKAVPILRALDKLAKIDTGLVIEEMINAGVPPGDAGALVKMVEIPEEGAKSAKRAISDLRHFFSITPNDKAKEGIDRLEQLVLAAETARIPDGRIKIDLGICRGLDYYTGTIYETFLTDMPKIGSVCSGGRYDNLAGLYTKQALPGVGASLGLDRLLAALEELKLLKGTTTPAPVFIVQFTAERIGDYQRMARGLRAVGIGAEVFPDAKKLGQQFQYAEKRGHKIALIAGPDDFAAGTWNVKDLAKREEKKGVPDAEVAALVQAMLGER